MVCPKNFENISALTWIAWMSMSNCGRIIIHRPNSRVLRRFSQAKISTWSNLWMNQWQFVFLHFFVNKAKFNNNKIIILWFQWPTVALKSLTLKSPLKRCSLIQWKHVVVCVKILNPTMNHLTLIKSATLHYPIKIMGTQNFYF